MLSPVNNDEHIILFHAKAFMYYTVFSFWTMVVFCINKYCYIVYECIVNAYFVNPANYSIWNTCFSYCHGPGYDRHLYVKILWNFSIKMNK